MTTSETAAYLGMQVQSLAIRVYQGKLAPEQPIGSGVGPSGWTFTRAEVERFKVERDAGNEKRRRWNGSSLPWRKAG